MDPLPPGPRAAHNAGSPREHEGLVGRERELSQLRALFGAGVVLVTLTGAPGVGKTRLAATFAASFEGSVTLCDLAEARSLDDALLSIARALDVPLEEGGDRGIDQLGRAIASRPDRLVVLDTFEHLVEPVAGALGKWIDAAPEACFLVTSRERVHLSAEHCLELEALSVPDANETDGDAIAKTDAVRLWMIQARRVRVDYTLRADEAPIVATIVRRLDGLPLAIELAAARASVLGPAQLLERLDRRFELLVGSSRSSAPKASLRGAIASSWDLLDEREKNALLTFSVFRRGFDLDAVEGVLENGAETGLALVQALTEKSLLRARGTDADVGLRRYDLLDSIRDYAADVGGPLLDAEARHATYFVRAARARKVEGKAAIASLRWLRRETENLLAVYERAMANDPPTYESVERALDVLLSLDPVFMALGPIGSHVERLDRALQHAGRVGDESGAVGHALAARVWARLIARAPAHDPALVQDLERAVFLSERAGNRAASALARIGLAAIHGILREKDTPLVESLFEKARSALEGVEAPSVICLHARHYGQFLWRTGRRDQAIAALERALSRLREIGSPRDVGIVLGTLGERYLESGMLAEARAHFEPAVDLIAQMGDLRNSAVYLGCLGILEQEQGRLDEARVRFERALVMEREVGAWYYEGWVTCHLGNLALEQGAPEEACARYRRAVELVGNAGDGRLTNALLGAALAMAGHTREAEKHLDRAAEMLQAAPGPGLLEALDLLRGQLSLARARDASRLGAHEDAAKHRAEAEAALVRSGAAAADAKLEDVRLARRLLAKALATGARNPHAGAEASREIELKAWHFDHEGRWFEPPEGERVDLRRRELLCRLLRALIALRIERPGAVLSVNEVVSAVWPGERLLAEAAAARVYTSVKYLRRLGLGEVLMTRGSGYLLDPHLLFSTQSGA